jgi:bacterioferritin-associated ferredoxin
MLVCLCNGISDKQIDSALSEGASNFKDIKSSLGIGNCCGQCVPFAKEMVSEKITEIQSAQSFHLAHEIHF